MACNLISDNICILKRYCFILTRTTIVCGLVSRRALYFVFVQNRGLLNFLKVNEYSPIFYLKLGFRKGFEHILIVVARIFQKLVKFWCFCINPYPANVENMVRS